MNPDRIYSQYRDDALADLITAKEYKTFVAMPFADRFSYRSRQIYRNVFQAAAQMANKAGTGKRPFVLPKRVDEEVIPALTITEEIVSQILFSHFFLGDLTFANPGVLLETGVAMGLKSNTQIILVSQGDPKDLHFDIRNVSLLSYNGDDGVRTIAKALLYSARAFEQEADRVVVRIKESLTPQALSVLNIYGRLRRQNPVASLHPGVAPLLTKAPDNLRQFDDATRELLSRRLISTDYRAGIKKGVDGFGMHATDLGWAVIGQIWPVIARGSTLPGKARSSKPKKHNVR